MSLHNKILIGVLALAASPAFAAVRLTYQLNGNAVPVAWLASSFPIRYSVDRAVASKLDVVDRAFNDWTTIADASVSFKSNGVVDGAKAGMDGVNTVTIAEGLFADQKFIAMTTNWYDDNAHIKEADIQLDPGVLSGNYNTQQVIEHEVGHLLGLDHAAVLSSIMYPYVGLGGVATLDSDDKIAIANLYPRSSANGAVLSGKVMGDGGAIYAAQVVAINDNGEPVASSLTDQNGEFELHSVPAGNYRIYAEPLDGPVDVRNLSGLWRLAKVISFPTQFADGGTLRVENGKIYGNLNVNSPGSIQLNPKWVGAFDPALMNLSLSSTTVVLAPGQTTAIAVAGDGFISGMTTFDIPNRGIKRVSDFKYSGNYVYATFTIAPETQPESVVIFVKTGNESAALTGALRVAPRVRGRAVRR